MIKGELTITSPAGKMPAYVARPDSGAHPAVIMLQGVYGFDDEIKRMTDLVASAGFVGLAIDYLRGQDVKTGFKSATVTNDISAALDWLNMQDFVVHGKIATWGFGVGGSVAFMASTVPGLRACIAFYGQSIAKALPDGGDAPIKNAEHIRTPLLLVFGGRDEQIAEDDINRIKTRLDAANKKYDVQIYANVGHSFFREDSDTIATREIADAWDRVKSYLERNFK